MATFTADRAAAGFPVYGGTHGNLRVAYGTYDIAANPADGDIYELVKVPKGAVVLGGYLMADDLDTDGTEALDIDLGWAANGVDEADADGFGNYGVWVGDAVAGIKPEAGIWMPMGGVLLTEGPKTFAAETTIQLEANAAATAGGTGVVTLVVFYVVP